MSIHPVDEILGKVVFPLILSCLFLWSFLVILLELHCYVNEANLEFESELLNSLGILFL